jgi:uncharacterized protein YraI
MTDQNQNTNQNPPTPQPSSGSSTILIGILIVIVIVALAVIAFLIFGGSGSDTDCPPAQPCPTCEPCPVCLPTAAPQPTPIPPAVEVPTAVPGTPLVTALIAINVRSGPSTDFPSYGVATEGDQAVVIGVSPDGGWWQIQVKQTDLVPSGEGWVSAEYVQAENVQDVPEVSGPELPPPVEVPPPDPNGPTATALDAINVRGGPGTSYPSYGIAPKGSQAAVIGVSEDGRWWVVRVQQTNLVPSGEGWVSADWVLVENAQGVPVIPAP